jgi:hypothetical protein
MSYTQQLQDIRQSIISEITDIIKRKGDNPYELIDLTDEHLHWQDEFYDLPRGEHINKYSQYDDYALVTVSLNGDSLRFEGVSIDCDAYLDEYVFGTDSLRIEVLADILDLIIKLES